MMQRSHLLFIALAGLGIPTGYLLLEGWGAMLIMMAVGAAALVAAFAPREEPAPQPVRRIRGRASPAMASGVAGVAFEPTQPFFHASTVGARMERGAALAARAPEGDLHERSLRLTGDALRSMQTGRTTRGRCSRCNATIWLSGRRPVKARCPVCGHTRVLP